VRLNQGKAALALGWSKSTVGRALDDLEAAGSVRRMKALGHQGLLVELRPRDH
jgi:predicted transcriptional regulator